MIKKIMSFFAVSFLLFVNTSFAENINNKNGIKKTFTISAYYSPLPNQERYATGSYEKDIILNGRGVRAADGTPVYEGMLAAPKKYAFGTKIYIPTLGLGTVHDRGGAIVEAGKRNEKFDRIDVWMGYGDEGLRRALNWGKKNIEGIVYNSGISTNYNEINVVDLSNKKVVHDKNLKYIQKELKNLGYFKGNIDGKNNEELRNAILEFQIDYKVLQNRSQQGAGIFGPKTQATLTDVIKNKKNEDYKIAKDFIEIFPINLALGDNGVGVERVQRMLNNQGFFNGKIDGNFNQLTKNSLISYQIKNNIVNSKNDYGAGVFGPKTQKSFFTVYEKKQKSFSRKTDFIFKKTKFTSDENLIITSNKNLKSNTSNDKTFAVMKFNKL